MLGKNGDERRGRRYLGAIVCILMGVLLGVWHNRVTARGQTDPLTSLVRTIVTPVVRAVSGVTDWGGRQMAWIWRGRALAVENRQLLAENARLREDNARLHEADATAQRLRAHLGFQLTPPRQKIAADVVSLRPDPHFATMIIARGTRDGVHMRSVVVSPNGLVGYVYDVGPTTASVLSLTDSYSAVGAMVQRPESRATGVCRGNGSGLLSLAYLNQDADVKVGDTIISSGLGGDQGIFPKGFVIGTVTTVENDIAGFSRRVTVRPAVNFDHLEEVYVLQ